MKKFNIKFAAILVLSIISLLSFMFLNTIDFDDSLSKTEHVEESVEIEPSDDIHLPDVYFWVNTIEKIKDILTIH